MGRGNEVPLYVKRVCVCFVLFCFFYTITVRISCDEPSLIKI